VAFARGEPARHAAECAARTTESRSQAEGAAFRTPRATSKISVHRVVDASQAAASIAVEDRKIQAEAHRLPLPALLTQPGEMMPEEMKIVKEQAK